MIRLYHILLTLAILFSVISFGYYLTEVTLMLFGQEIREPNYGSYFGSDDGNSWAVKQLIRYLIYWSMGLIIMFIAGRVLKEKSYWKNALILSGGYLLILGSYGGLELNGNAIARLILSGLNVAIFIVVYKCFEAAYYTKNPINQETKLKI